MRLCFAHFSCVKKNYKLHCDRKKQGINNEKNYSYRWQRWSGTSFCRTLRHPQGGGITVVNISRTPCLVPNVTNIKCDLSVQSDIDSAVKEIQNSHSNFDAIINTAAIVGMEKINEITFEKFNRTWQVNAVAPLYFLSRLYDDIVRNEADILNVGATIDLGTGPVDMLAYTATKHGLKGGTYNFGMELKNTNSRAIYVHCGGMNTKMHQKDYGVKIEDPNAWMSPQEIAKILLYLIELPKQIEISDITINRKGRRYG